MIFTSVAIGIATAKRFGQGVLFGLGLAILPFIFYPILAFGNYTYLPVTEK